MRDKDTFNDTWNKMEQEGSGYYFLQYTDGEELPDKESKKKKLFKKANRALRNFIEYIGKQKDIERLEGK